MIGNIKNIDHQKNFTDPVNKQSDQLKGPASDRSWKRSLADCQIKKTTKRKICSPTPTNQ